tara:strand:+ start:929 stop:1342 length:414 start_codon:yes stop_codon:yes gene_type:complete
MVLRLSWSMQRRIERWKIKYAKIIDWSIFIKQEVVKDFNKVKGFLQKIKYKKEVKKMKIDENKKETIFFDSEKYIGVTVDKGELGLIKKPPQNKITEVLQTVIKPSWSEHDRNCDCEECLDTLIEELKFKFDTENDF